MRILVPVYELRVGDIVTTNNRVDFLDTGKKLSNFSLATDLPLVFVEVWLDQENERYLTVLAEYLYGRKIKDNLCAIKVLGEFEFSFQACDMAREIGKEQQ